MPQPKNTALRIIVPLIAIAVGCLVVYSSLKSPTNATSNPAATPPSSVATPAAAPATPVDPSQVAPPPAPPSDPTQAAATTTPVPDQVVVPPAGPSTGQPLATSPLRARIFNQLTASALTTLGSQDKKSDLRSYLEFSTTGSGIKSLQLARHFNTIKEKKDGNTEIQAEHSLAIDSQIAVMTPFAALAIEITPPTPPQGTAPQPPQVFELAGSAAAPLWSPIAGQGQGAFEAFIEDASGNAVLRLERKYVLTANSNDIRLLQRAENLTATPLTIRWFQFGPVDLPADSAGYGGEKRHLRFGYLFPTERDPSRFVVTQSGLDKARQDVLEKRYPTPNAQGHSILAYRDYTLWPNPESTEGKYEATWLAFTNRYFGVSVHSLYTPSIVPGQKPMGGASPIPWLGQVDRVVLDGGDLKEVIGLRLISRPIALAAVGTGQSVTDLSHGIYAGPLNRREITAEPLLASLNLHRIVVYNFGGPCGWCTFDSLTGLLLWVLHWLHDLIFRDWALSIIFLVVVVRTILHPVTRWTQIKMNRFSKQMQSVGPKQKILQEKYASDPAKLQQETAKLWREEGISPAGFLGCLPSFLQSPIWIALSAVLFFAVELRHQGGFYNFFQRIQPDTSPFWYFLGDLAEPDRFVYFERTIFELPLLGPITSINLLPLLLGVVFFLQQKYLTPPSATPLTPEQEMQQKIIKYMTVIMFPVMMYNAPAGLTLYFVVNSTLAIFESRWIRSYMDKHGLLDLDKMRAERLARKKSSGRPGQSEESGGFLSAIQKYAQKAQEQEKERRFGQDKPKR